MHGKTGELFTIRVPVGTVVKQLPLRKDTGEEVPPSLLSFLCHFPITISDDCCCCGDDRWWSWQTWRRTATASRWRKAARAESKQTPTSTSLQYYISLTVVCVVCVVL